MSGQRVVRPAELPRQRGTQPSDPSRKRAGHPPAAGAPRPGRRAPSRCSPVAESLFGFLICAAVIAATALVVAVVFANWLGLA